MDLPPKEIFTHTFWLAIVVPLIMAVIPIPTSLYWVFVIGFWVLLFGSFILSVRNFYKTPKHIRIAHEEGSTPESFDDEKAKERARDEAG